MSIVKSLVCGAVMLRLAAAQDVSCKNESDRVSDVARTIQPSGFERSALLEAFRAWMTAECFNRPLARLTLAPSQTDLANAVNTNLLDLTSEGVNRLAMSTPSLLGAGIPRTRAAQGLCLGGNATVTIRNASEVTHHQIAGSHDSRQWQVKGVDITLVGFRLSALHSPIWWFVKANPLPDVSAAAAIRDLLEEMTQVPTTVVIRTDGAFWDFNGPKGDVFNLSVQTISGGDFLRRPYVVCAPRGDRGKCQVRTSH